VLFDAPVAAMVQRREVRALLTDARLPEDLLAALRAVRGYGIFRARGGDGGKPVDEGWDLDRARTAAEAVPKRRALHGLFGRLGRRSRPRTRRR